MAAMHTSCPKCRSGVRLDSTPCKNVHETVFECGAWYGQYGADKEPIYLGNVDKSRKKGRC